MGNNSSATPFLGLYVIVRDAEKTIDALLASLRGTDGNWAFDELVFVDTGSVDLTTQKIAAAVGSVGGWPNSGYLVVPRLDGLRIILSRFDWCDDFAAARNYAFGLGSARWRMYLDADDELKISGADAHHLKKALQHTEHEHPEVDCIMLRYLYADPIMIQDKFRLVRWDTGWRWEGEIHEEIVPWPVHGRRISVYGEITVVHQENRDVQRSITRNVALCTKLYERAGTENNISKRARMAYYLGMYATMHNDLARAKQLFREAADGLGFTNLAAYALVDLAFLYLKNDLPHEAIAIAGEAHARCPEIPDGLAALACALEAAGDNLRAAGVFDQWKALLASPIQSNRDRYRHEGLVPITAVRSYLAIGRIADAADMLKRVSKDVALTDSLYLHYTAAGAAYFQTLGLARLKDYVDYLVWENEILQALAVIDEAPSNIRALPEISAMRKTILDKAPQLESWADYKRVYAAETNEVFDRDEKSKELITQQGRAQHVKKWAENLSRLGPPIELYVIGVHGGWIEQEVLAANERIRLTACDVNPNANYALQRLAKLFPGRVKFHTVVHNHYDWIPEDKYHEFDALFCFEVIEHVPNPQFMARQFTLLLKPNGELFLSTPISSFWIEPDATKRHHWHQHLTAWEPWQLWHMLYDFGFRGNMLATDNRVLHLCHMRWNGIEPMDQPLFDSRNQIVIWCPRIHKAFDPSSISTGHLGGSEEAVVHLSRALARTGAWVIVYGWPIDQDNRVHVDQNVLWMENRHFDPLALTGCVLVWRSPTDAAWLKKQVGSRVRVLNWLHDSSYVPCERLT